jgi:hypothetical protein
MFMFEVFTVPFLSTYICARREQTCEQAQNLGSSELCKHASWFLEKSFSNQK